ncbi:thiamine pyrophosphate-dependent enzyme [Streptomyces sp. NPDC127166]|uniref:thiamine pyrophosphate-dependent enzyme n=1 Tax=Streptomyces sp. NPDC127166 TaxID=3345380 RepID=UPI00363A62AD
MTTSVSCSHPSPTARPARSARHCSGSATWWTSHPATRPDTVADRAAAAGLGGGVRPRPSRAKSAHPDRPGIAIVGDGAMRMNGLAEPITAAKYHRERSDPRLVVAVLDDQDLDQVAWEMRAMRGAPQLEPSQDLPDVRHADIAQLLGPHGVRVERPEGVEAAWRQTLAADRSFVIDFRTDPAVPPIPPHADGDQIKAAASSVPKGDSDRGSVVRQGLKAKIQEFLPGGRS